MATKNKNKSDFLPQHLKVFAPKNEQNVQGFFRAVVPEMNAASDEELKYYLRNLSIEELMFISESNRFLKNNIKHDLTDYPLSVQNCLKATNNFLLFKGQLESLFILAGGDKGDAVQFRRNWNKKLRKTREEDAASMLIEGYSLKKIIEDLAYDTENFFVCTEDLDFAQEIKAFIKDENVEKLLNSTSLTYIHYLGDTSSDKRNDINRISRSHIKLKYLDESNFWLSFSIVKDSIFNDFHYNLLGEYIQNNVSIMNPSFFQNSGSGKFFFTATLVWHLDDNLEHFEFGARYKGELPKGIHVVEII